MQGGHKNISLMSSFEWLLLFVLSCAYLFQSHLGSLVSDVAWQLTEEISEAIDAIQKLASKCYWFELSKQTQCAKVHWTLTDIVVML